jgi:colicin import membrane protein
MVHGLLVIALALGVRWHASEPEGVVAELWASVPQIAAPKAVEPEPPPRPAPPKPVVTPKVETPPPPTQAQRDADIAIEKARQREEQAHREQEEAHRLREEKQRQAAEKAAAERQAQKERERQQQLEAEKRKREEEEQQRQLAALRAKQMERIMGMAGASGEAGAKGSAMQSSGPSATYAGRIRARIKPNIVFTDDLPDNPTATLQIRLAPDGTIVGTPRLVKSSGSKAWDDAVIRAVVKTETLPRDVDGRVPPLMEIDFRPRE